MTLKEQKKIVKEIVMLHRDKLGQLKSQVQQSSLENPALTLNINPLPRLQSLPLEDPSIYALLNENFEIISQLKEDVV